MKKALPRAERMGEGWVGASVGTIESGHKPAHRKRPPMHRLRFQNAFRSNVIAKRFKPAALALGGLLASAAAGAAPLPDCTPNVVNDPLICLACNIYHEARSESEEGQLAVAMVTLNRVRSPHYPNDLCRVVWQKGTDRRSGLMVAQFSWTLDDRPDAIRSRRAWRTALALAEYAFALAEQGQPDPSDGATHFHAHYVDPYWARGPEMSFLTRIGAHLFYRADGQGRGHEERLAHLGPLSPPTMGRTFAERRRAPPIPIPATLDEARAHLASAALGNAKLLRLAAWMSGESPWEGYAGKRIRLGGGPVASP